MWATKRPASISNRPSKKLVIKGLKSIPVLPPNYKEDTWARLKHAVRAIQNKEPTEHGLEELYRDCESLCLHRYCSEMYNGLQEELERYTRERLSGINSEADKTTESTVLENMRKFWVDYVHQLSMIRCIFLYLDRTYVLQNAGMASLWTMGLGAVRRYLVDTDMKTRLTRLIIGEITKERDGKSVDRGCLRVLTGMYSDLGLYTTFFTPALIITTNEYYERESRRLVGTLSSTLNSNTDSIAMDVPQYLVHVKKRLDEESQRVTQYLSAETRSALVAATVSELIEKHTDRILDLSFESIMDGDLVDDLSNLYQLLSQVRRLDTLKTHWSSYIKKVGTKMVQSPELDARLVSDLLNFKARLDNILKNAFQMNEALVHALRESFEVFINMRNNKPAQLIAKFIDQSMRSGNKTAVDEDLESLLNRVLVLFRFIQSKDIFEAFYKRDLSKRLLYHKSASKDAEKAMLHNLKQECGAGFTNKLDGMFRDIELSEELNAKFKDSELSHNVGAFDFRACALTQAFWPTYQQMNIVAPREAENAQSLYAQFYDNNFKGRNLQWQPSLGTCLLKVQFDEGVKELSMTLVQGTVLCLFSERDRYSYKEIQESTGLDDAELQRTLQSLSCAKFRVLLKEPKGKSVSATDVFAFNGAFTSPLVRIKISQIQLKEAASQETKETEERVQLDRMYKIDAAIVRVMKSRKSLGHTSLLTELMTQLRFVTNASELKKRIDSLIEREYLERDESDQSLYKYVA